MILRILVLLTFVFFVIACAPAEPAAPEPEADAETEVEAEPEAEAETEPEAEAESEAEPPTGDELIANMQAAMENASSVQFTADFQIATPDGPTAGTLSVAAERPGKFRAEITSEDIAEINGLLAVSNEEMGWIYNPVEELVVVDDKSQFNSQFDSQPELREVVDFGEEMVAEGFDDNTTAEILGEEDIAGRATYQVQVTYTAPASEAVDLTSVTPIFWIDQETYLPQRIEITISEGDVTVSGFMVVTDPVVVDEDIDDAMFTFEPPEGTTVLDLSEFAPPPSFEMPETE